MIRIGTLSELESSGPTGALKFVVRQTKTASGITFDDEGFAFLRDGRVRAFENQCQHQPIELDLDDADFFDKKGEFIQCKTHGARYDPLTGVCIKGPPGCKGKALLPLVATVDDDGSIFVTLPDGDATA